MSLEYCYFEVVAVFDNAYINSIEWRIIWFIIYIFLEVWFKILTERLENNNKILYIIFVAMKTDYKRRVRS